MVMRLETGILVIGAGGAGMLAALTAAEKGARVALIDRSLIGRGGATVMAQMTVAAALGEETPDHWTHHLADTLAAGRGLCDEGLARLLCEEGVATIRQLDQWKTGWARENGHIKQVHAPGHDRPRCTYVDFLNTGPAVSKTLRTRLNRHAEITRIGDLCVVDIVVADGEACGAVALHVPSGEAVLIAANAVIIATGGLTRLYRRNSASANMGGDGYALALRAGATLLDMEFVQFFPIGHLAPRLVGMDPIMWDPFRYKLGGRLLNGRREEFVENYGVPDQGRYVVTRDVATYAITKEVEAGRGSPAGGAYLSFAHIPEADLRKAFGPIIDRLARNGIDLTKQAVEVAPMAHYHMGGIGVDARMATSVPGLFAGGEAVGGANGANRLSGNAITEAVTFGKIAGDVAAQYAARRSGARPALEAAAKPALDLVTRDKDGAHRNTAAMIETLQAVMQDNVGPFRTGAKLARALEVIRGLKAELGDAPFGKPGVFDSVRLDWLDLRNMLLVAETVALAALARQESRGAHQREDFPTLNAAWEVNQLVTLADGAPQLGRRALRQKAEA